MPTTLRIALLTGLLALASNLAVIGFIYWHTHDTTIDDLKRETVDETRALTEIYQFGGDEAVRSEVAATAAAGKPDELIALANARHQPIAGNIDPGSLAKVAFRPGTQILALARTGDRRSHDAVIQVRSLGGLWLISGRQSEGGLALRELLERSLLIGSALALVLGAFSAGLTARFVVRRIRDIADVTEGFSRGDFSRRAAVGRGGDAFAALAGQINRMLDRIATLMDELKALSDSLAHDLRSPVGRLRVAADAALQTNDPAERQQLLGSILRQSDALMRILTTVLEIGKSESLIARNQFELFDPCALVAEVAEMYEPLTEDRGLRFALRAPSSVQPLFGHRQLIAQALSNLIENALTYGAAGGEITLTLDDRPDSVSIGVADRGPGIARDQRATARARFGRLDPSRSVHGAGLGLTLVEAIAHAHGGKLVLCDNSPGLVAEVVIPRQPLG